jgi:general stress protein 26
MTPLALDERGTFWFFTDVRSAKVDHLRMLNLSFSDTARSVYVSLSGHGEIDADRSRIDLLWSLSFCSWFPEGPRSPNLVLLKFLPHAADAWDQSSNKLLQLFASAASKLLGRAPAWLGEHHALQGFAATAGVAPASVSVSVSASTVAREQPDAWGAAQPCAVA